MNNYRLTLIIKENLEEKERKALLDDVVKSFGEMTKEDLWGVRPLAYEIQHGSKGYYAHYEFSSEPQTIAALDKKLKLNEEIIRYLLLKHQPRTIKAKRVSKADKSAEEKVAKTDKVVEVKSEAKKA
jgi:small subunit ribosomal protein S6